MRLVPVCLPLVLAPFIVAGQQAQPSATQKSAQATAVKQSSSAPHKKTSKRSKRHRARKATVRRNRKRTESNTIPVDIINGGETRHVVLDKASTSPSAERSKPGQVKVEVINGSAADTQYFSDKNPENARNQSVVVGVQSGDTRFAGGDKVPVVTSVTSSSSVDARSASAGGQTVTKQISPKPKRPAYSPDQH